MRAITENIIRNARRHTSTDWKTITQALRRGQDIWFDVAILVSKVFTSTAITGLYLI